MLDFSGWLSVQCKLNILFVTPKHKKIAKRSNTESLKSEKEENASKITERLPKGHQKAHQKVTER